MALFGVKKMKTEMQCVFAAVLGAFLIGCATRDIAVVDVEAKTLTYNGKRMEPFDLLPLAASHEYGAADLIIRSTNGVEKADLRKTMDELSFWILLPLLAPDREATNTMNRTPN